MADDIQPDSQPTPRPPVRMGLRVVARHSAGRHGGRALARDVVESHRPKLLDASTRLARHPSEAPAPPAPPAPPMAAAPAQAPLELPEFFSPDFDAPAAPSGAGSGVI